jgi:hypothetical protein
MVAELPRVDDLVRKPDAFIGFFIFKDPNILLS